MAYFAVSYQLNEEKDYQSLWDELERLDGHKVMRSFYFLDLDQTDPEIVKNHLKKYIDDDDQLAVIPMPQEPAVYRGYTGTNNWLKGRF